MEDGRLVETLLTRVLRLLRSCLRRRPGVQYDVDAQHLPSRLALEVAGASRGGDPAG